MGDVASSPRLPALLPRRSQALLAGGVPSGHSALRSASLLEELRFYFPSSLVESPPRIPVSAARLGEAWELWEHLPLPSADTRGCGAGF